MHPGTSLRAACVLSLLIALPACNKAVRKAAESMPDKLNVVDVAEEPAPMAMEMAPPPIPPAPTAPPAPSTSSAIPIHVPQISYSYRYGFTVPSGGLEAMQKVHLAACDRLGPTRCQLVAMSRNGSDQWETGQLSLKVDANIARNFGTDLEKTVSGRGGSLSESSISAEDLSKQIVDTDARVKAKTLLAQRLTELLATRRGTTIDLVTAERALSDVLEEVDSSRSQLAEMKGRVVLSDISINYSTQQTAAGSAYDPVKEAFESVGVVFGTSLAMLLRFVVVILPWSLALFGLVKLYRALGGRFPRLRRPWRKATGAEAPAQPSE